MEKRAVLRALAFMLLAPGLTAFIAGTLVAFAESGGAVVFALVGAIASCIGIILLIAAEKTLPKFQLHLSTTLLVTIVASALLLWNVEKRPSHVEGVAVNVRGWPLRFQLCIDADDNRQGIHGLERWNSLTFAFDVCLSLTALCGIGALAENCIRHHEAHR
jgi:hypothetical protein